MTATIERIMQLCGDMPNPAAHRHYLEQLRTRELQQRLADLEASEARHGGRWVAGRCRMKEVAHGNA